MDDDAQPVAGIGNEESLSECVYCGVVLTQTTFTWDHVIPTCRGGKNEKYNMAPACRGCNNAKGPLTAKEYLSVRSNHKKLKDLRDSIHRRLTEEALQRRGPSERDVLRSQPLPVVPPPPPKYKPKSPWPAPSGQPVRHVTLVMPVGKPLRG